MSPDACAFRSYNPVNDISKVVYGICGNLSIKGSGNVVIVCLDWVLDPLGPGTPMGWALRLRLRLRLTSRLLWKFLWMGVEQGKPWTDVDSPHSWKECL